MSLSDAMLLNQNKLNLTKMRDLKHLKDCGMHLSTASNEVAKLWDSLLFQLYGYFDAPETNGIIGCVDRIRELDPEFPLTKIISLDVPIDDQKLELNKLKLELKKQFESTSLDRKWTDYEKAHMKALVYMLEGYDALARECWLDLLSQHPKDILALKGLNLNCIITGYTEDIANPFTLCRREMAISDVFYPLILSHEAFGLEEKGQLTKALEFSNESLAIYPWNSWATHCMAHIFDSNGDSKSGIEFMNRTRSDWINGNALTGHNNWHFGLFHLHQGETSAALEIFDTEIFPKLKEQYNSLGMSDAVSLLTKMELENVSYKQSNRDLDITERWSELSKSIGSAINTCTGFEFYDAHLALAMMGTKQPKVLAEFRDNCKDWVDKFENRIFETWECDSFTQMYRSGQAHPDRYVTKSRRLLPLTEALTHFMNGDYQACVNILYPIRKELRRLGGSKAQNDIFYQLLAAALFNAGGPDNLCRLKLLFLDRKDVKENNYYKRMESKLLELHL